MQGPEAYARRCVSGGWIAQSDAQDIRGHGAHPEKTHAAPLSKWASNDQVVVTALGAGLSAPGRRRGDCAPRAYKLKNLSRVKARLNEELWQKYIYHSDRDRYIFG